MRSPLRIRASNKVIDFAIGDQALPFQELIAVILVADFVRVDSCAGAAGDGADYGTLLTANQTTEQCTTNCAPRSSDLVPVGFPNRAILAVIGIVRDDIAISVDVYVVAIRIDAIGVISILGNAAVTRIVAALDSG